MDSKEMKGTTITMAAGDAGITPDQARYWVKLLGLTVHKIGRNRCIDAHGVAQIREMGRMTAAGKTPQEAAAILTTAQVAVFEEIAPPAVVHPQVAARLDGVEQSMVAVLEKMARMEQQMAALATENQSLRERVDREAAITKALLAPPEKNNQVIPWQPQPLPDPLEGAPWWKRLWVEITAPEMLRRSH